MYPNQNFDIPPSVPDQNLNIPFFEPYSDINAVEILELAAALRYSYPKFFRYGCYANKDPLYSKKFTPFNFMVVDEYV